MKFNTKCVHGSGKPDSTGAISLQSICLVFSIQSWGYNRLSIFIPSLIQRDRLGTIDSWPFEEGTDALLTIGMAVWTQP